MEIEMKIRGLMMDPTANTPIVILKDVAGESLLPIWVGTYEANAIATEIEKMSSQRPMTHDLMRNVIREMGGKLRRVVITSLIDNTFYAFIEIEKDGNLLIVDSRPSDALALSLRMDCPIYVAQQVIKSSSATLIDGTSSTDEWPEDFVEDNTSYKM
ncbi:MAG: hypothetical protein DMF61_16880 [Blastocatellia bacterium AA13]|nr:MAG: hypothetical protein DMF61_16880 [Blastocatellia bacterium AA13]